MNKFDLFFKSFLILLAFSDLTAKNDLENHYLQSYILPLLGLLTLAAAAIESHQSLASKEGLIWFTSYILMVVGVVLICTGYSVSTYFFYRVIVSAGLITVMGVGLLMALNEFCHGDQRFVIP